MRWSKSLNAIWEEDFLGFSYGFRPGRGQHDALDALAVGICQRKVNWILGAGIAGFFDAVSHDWLIRFVEHRVGDRRVVRLIRKWLKAGMAEDGQVTPGEVGTPQGAVISPLLANIYLHYVFDLWADQWRRRHAHGDVIMVRYADDIVVGFEHQARACPCEGGGRAVLGGYADAPGGLRLDAPPGEDAAHRVRTPCGEEPAGARSRQSGDVQFSWLHSYQRAGPAGRVPA